MMKPSSSSVGTVPFGPIVALARMNSNPRPSSSSAKSARMVQTDDGRPHSLRIAGLPYSAASRMTGPALMTAASTWGAYFLKFSLNISISARAWSS
jgi:hypothetical protein